MGNPNVNFPVSPLTRISSATVRLLRTTYAVDACPELVGWKLTNTVRDAFGSSRNDRPVDELTHDLNASAPVTDCMSKKRK